MWILGRSKWCEIERVKVIKHLTDVCRQRPARHSTVLIRHFISLPTATMSGDLDTNYVDESSVRPLSFYTWLYPAFVLTSHFSGTSLRSLTHSRTSTTGTSLTTT